MEFSIQSTSGNDHTAAWHTEFKLSALHTADVPGVPGVGREVFTGNIVFFVDMVQPSQREIDKMRNTFLYSGSSGEQFSFTAFQRIIF